MGRKLFHFLLSALAPLFFFVRFSCAEAPAVMPIIQAGPLVYADVQGHLYVVVVRGASESGIFVAYSPTGVPIQQFSPDQLPADTAVLFLSYDPAKNSYRQIILSDSQHYNIQGSFRVRIGPDAWMGVDTFNNPYTSIVVEREGQKPTILAFVGLEKVVLMQDEKAAALLAATQSLEGYRSFLDEYRLTTSGLLLKNIPLKINQLGFQVSSQNSCLGKETLRLTKLELIAGKKLSGEPLKKFIEQHQREGQSSLDALITIKMTDDEITGYLPDKQLFYFVEREKDQLGEKQVCTVSTAQL